MEKNIFKRMCIYAKLRHFGLPWQLMVMNLPAMRETWVRSLGQEEPLEKGMANPLQYSCLENSMNRGL